MFTCAMRLGWCFRQCWASLWVCCSLEPLPNPFVKAVLAAVIIAFSAHSLRGGKHRELKNDKFAWLFGFGAGVLGGPYGMNGPPLVVYGSLRRWSPQHFRATLQGYFPPASLAGMWGYGLAILATFLGRMINRRMGPQRFLLYVDGGLIFVGIVLLLQAVAG